MNDKLQTKFVKLFRCCYHTLLLFCSQKTNMKNVCRNMFAHSQLYVVYNYLFLQEFQFNMCLVVYLLQAFRKFDALATNHTEKLRKLTKQVQEHRQNHDDDAVKRVVEEYDETLEW